MCIANRQQRAFVRMEKLKTKINTHTNIKSNIQKLAKKELPTVPIKKKKKKTKTSTTTKARGCPQLGDSGNGRKYLPTPWPLMFGQN